jgi:hypothetical protein
MADLKQLVLGRRVKDVDDSDAEQSELPHEF